MRQYLVFAQAHHAAIDKLHDVLNRFIFDDGLHLSNSPKWGVVDAPPYAIADPVQGFVIEHCGILHRETIRSRKSPTAPVHADTIRSTIVGAGRSRFACSPRPYVASSNASDIACVILISG